MSDLDAEVADLKTRIAAAQRARSRAELERDAAAAQAAKARTQLQDEFGVVDTDAANAMLATLDDDLRTAITDLRTALDEAGV